MIESEKKLKKKRKKKKRQEKRKEKKRKKPSQTSIPCIPIAGQEKSLIPL